MTKRLDIGYWRLRFVWCLWLVTWSFPLGFVYLHSGIEQRRLPAEAVVVYADDVIGIHPHALLPLARSVMSLTAGNGDYLRLDPLGHSGLHFEPTERRFHPHLVQIIDAQRMGGLSVYLGQAVPAAP